MIVDSFGDFWACVNSCLHAYLFVVTRVCVCVCVCACACACARARTCLCTVADSGDSIGLVSCSNDKSVMFRTVQEVQNTCS